MNIDPGIRTGAPAFGLQGPLASFLAVALCIVAVLALFWPTTASMVEIWWRSETFQHCFAVIPIVLWLVWNDRFRLSATAVRPFWPGLVLIAALGFAWLLGVLGAAQVVSHFALIGLVGAVVLTVFGAAWARVLWFPLAFLFFAVPFGEALVPRLMDWTADFTVAALRLSGVPVYREGTHFVIPTGQWSVIEACSGIKFLIASLMAGSLYAWLMYRSPGRRLAFIAASIVIPLVANWLRAYLIVIIGHLSHNRLMNNEDHIVFGWVLFAAFMLLLYWIGTHWREDAEDASARLTPAGAPGLALMAPVALAVVAAVAAWPVLGAVLVRPVGAADAPEIVTPAPAAGWQREPEALSSWVPDLEGAGATQTFVYRNGTQRVALFVAVFRHQTQHAQVGSTANQFARTTNLRWKVTADSTRRLEGAAVAGVANPLRAVAMRGPAAADQLLVWQWFWLADGPTISAGRTKLELARVRLLRRPDTSLWVAAYAQREGDGGDAARSLQQFVRDMGPSLQHAFAQTVAR